MVMTTVASALIQRRASEGAHNPLLPLSVLAYEPTLEDTRTGGDDLKGMRRIFGTSLAPRHLLAVSSLYVPRVSQSTTYYLDHQHSSALAGDSEGINSFAEPGVRGHSRHRRQHSSHRPRRSGSSQAASCGGGSRKEDRSSDAAKASPPRTVQPAGRTLAASEPEPDGGAAPTAADGGGGDRGSRRHAAVERSKSSYAHSSTTTASSSAGGYGSVPPARYSTAHFRHPAFVIDSLAYRYRRDVQLSALEEEELRAFRAYLQHNKLDIRKGPFLDDRSVLRYVQGNQYNYYNAADDMKKHLEWRKRTLPVLRSDVKEELKAGIVYVHGRDSSRHPIIIIKADRLNQVDRDQAIRTVFYWMEEVIAHMLVMGRVEQWVAIVDLNFTRFFGSNSGILKDIALGLLHNYRGRLSKLIFLNSDFILRSIFSALKFFLPESTRCKILFPGADESKPMLREFIHESQLETTYGGTAPPPTRTDIPIFPAGPLDLPTGRLRLSEAPLPKQL
eukprot:GHVU01007016.1.p1 GENE.GHVU01007016.1~~GHVU01007016.1.p1  ORF type:complete len:503 (+),score=65.25 GHVU01007016.1:333-1841(+)